MIAYVRIPKTASCTVLHALQGAPSVVSVDHEPIGFYASDITFTIVRNPWERLFSWYRHSKFFQRRTFRQYVLDPDDDPLNPVAPTQFYRHGNADQTNLLIADQRAWMTPRPTMVGSFENLERDLRFIGKTLGFPVGKIGHLNISKDTPAYPYSPDIWDTEMLERMGPMFEPFAEEFGYESP